jgi:tetratricopeptide (TPR) repeat protein
VAPPPAAAPPPPPPPAPAPAPDWRDAVTAFEKKEREAARAAQREGRYVDARNSWDVVLALQPGDAEASAGREHSGRSATEAAASLLSRARQAQARGDVEGAMRLYVETLSLDPAQSAAATALRGLEHERARRVTRQAFARAPTPRPMSPPMQAERNTLEHASLLAAEGEIDAAIAILTPLVRDARSDPAARARLADLRVRRAEMLAPTNRAAAVTEAEQALRIQPGHAGAMQLLQRLRALSGTAPQ